MSLSRHCTYYLIPRVGRFEGSPESGFLRRAQSDVTSRRSRRDELQQEKSKPETLSSPAVSDISPLCNLERFLNQSHLRCQRSTYLRHCFSTERDTAFVMTMRDWRTCNVEFHPFFVLSDLWSSFKEWSAYGVGVPLILNDSDGVVQYYVPYLSGIQLYADLSKSTTKLRRLGEESDSDYFRDSSSDGSSDSEQDRGGLQLNYPQTSDSSLRLDQLSSREQHMTFQEGFSSDEGESGSSQGCLLFEYLAGPTLLLLSSVFLHYIMLEFSQISDLAHHFPELNTLRSCDLLPSSWISVAWYPIYRIPTGPTLKDLDACFLTFHSLHTPMTGSEAMHPPIVIHPSESDGVPQISLPAFGLASYKYKVSLWTPNAGHQQLANSLLQEADDRLNSLRVNHPDFSFFCRKCSLSYFCISRVFDVEIVTGYPVQLPDVMYANCLGSRPAKCGLIAQNCIGYQIVLIVIFIMILCFFELCCNPESLRIRLCKVSKPCHAPLHVQHVQFGSNGKSSYGSVEKIM
ncbi:hypothetical protein DH2020_034218 [Rehmannia glutinosa]|uniref:Uncharacterized protein n=1 Tax=Rehmannia glutinosa TaxID=99300 RepID=A0ABR0VAX7_REHGL